MSAGTAELRVARPYRTDPHLGSTPNTRGPAKATTADRRRTWCDSARTLGCKLVQIHSAALLDGLELYPLDVTGVAAAAGSTPHPPTDAATRLAHQPS